MITDLESAIKHCEEVAEENEQNCQEGVFKDVDNATTRSFKECAAEHRQLAEWLKELKELRELYDRSEKQACDRCIHTYGTLGCCSTVHNEWVFDCDFGQEQYRKEREVQADEDNSNMAKY